MVHLQNKMLQRTRSATSHLPISRHTETLSKPGNRLKEL